MVRSATKSHAPIFMARKKRKKADHPSLKRLGCFFGGTGTAAVLDMTRNVAMTFFSIAWSHNSSVVSSSRQDGPFVAGLYPLRWLADVDASLLQLACEISAEGMVIDLGRVTQAAGILESGVVNLVLDRRFEVVWTMIPASDFGAGQFGLVIGQGPDAAERLEQTDEVQVLVIRVHHLEIKRHFLCVLEIDERLLKEREGDPEASAGAHDIEFLDLSVHEFNVATSKLPDRRARLDAPMTNEVKKIRVERWMVAQCWMGVNGQAVLAVRPLQQIQQFGQRELFGFRGKPVGASREDIGRYAKEKFGDEPLRTAHRYTYLAGKACGLYRNIAGRIASANNQHTFTSPILAEPLEVVRVHEDAGEFAGIFGIFGIPVVPVGDHQLVEDFGVRGASLIGVLHGPFAISGPRYFRHRMFEANSLIHLKVFRVGLEIRLKLPVTGIIWILVWHRIVLVLRPDFRADNMSIFVNAGVPCIGIEDPVAANFVILLKDNDVKTKLDRILRRGDTAWTGADDAYLHCAAHVVPSTLSTDFSGVGRNGR